MQQPPENDIAAICASYGDSAANLLEILHDWQHASGFISPDDERVVAAALNLSAAEVHGVVSFYPDFKTSPPARHTIKLCRAEACQAQGARTLEHDLTETYGSMSAEAAPGASVALEPVYCLGNCGLGPAAMVDGQLVGRANASRIDAILKDKGHE